MSVNQLYTFSLLHPPVPQVPLFRHPPVVPSFVVLQELQAILLFFLGNDFHH